MTTVPAPAPATDDEASRRLDPPTPWSALRLLYGERYLIGQLAWRETQARYRGSWLGALWTLLEPLLLFLLYTLVFTVVFQVRWGSGEENRAVYGINLFAGLVIYNLFADCLSSAPTLILGHASLVKKTVFPLETLPVARLVASLVHASFGLLILLAAVPAVIGRLPWTVVLLPVLLVPLALFLLALIFVFSALGVFVQDLSTVVRLLVMGAMFLSPVFYPVSRLPEAWQPLLAVNPLTYFIEEFRSLVIECALPQWGAALLAWVLCGLAAWLGLLVFMRCRRAFADVM